MLWERYRTFAELAEDPALLARPVVRLINQPGIGEIPATGTPLAQPGTAHRRPPRTSARTRLPYSANCGENGRMRRLTDTDGLTELQRDILRTVRDFVDAEVIPVASELDHADVYPTGSCSS